MMQHAAIVTDACRTAERRKPLSRYPILSERDAAYYQALRLVQRLDPHRDRNTAWFIGGKWAHTLDEAVRAILGEAE